MIERLLAADAALDRDDLETAHRLFEQVAGADPRNAIAVVGLARVAARRNAADEARTLAQRALDIDPEEAAARRLLDELLAPVIVPPAGRPMGVAPKPAPVSAPVPVATPAPRPVPRSRWRRWLDRFLRRA
jgi:tetratricopeptide (TPR) repeat protein